MMAHPYVFHDLFCRSALEWDHNSVRSLSSIGNCGLRIVPPKRGCRLNVAGLWLRPPALRIDRIPADHGFPDHFPITDFLDFFALMRENVFEERRIWHPNVR